jgi:hypothetical protein
MRSGSYILLFLLFAFCFSKAQDKLFLKNGQKKTCRIIAFNVATVDFKDTARNAELQSIGRSDILMAEKDGEVIIFGTELSPNISAAERKNTRIENKKAAIREKEQTFKNGIIGWQPLDLLWGRLTLTYERLLLDKKIGVMVPFILSFDPRVLVPEGNSNDTVVNTSTPVRRNTAIITGLDLNYYYETRSHSKFFFGPRFRYGTDVNLANITGYTIQFQNGFLLCDARGKMATTFALGFGFARITSTPFSSPFNPRQSFPWMSFTLRLGFRA